jgi:hypothetical protein
MKDEINIKNTKNTKVHVAAHIAKTTWVNVNFDFNKTAATITKVKAKITIIFWFTKDRVTSVFSLH